MRYPESFVEAVREALPGNEQIIRMMHSGSVLSVEQTIKDEAPALHAAFAELWAKHKSERGFKVVGLD